MLSDSQIILRGFIAYDFQPNTTDEAYPFPDYLMENLDLIKRPIVDKKSSFVDLLDNLSANDSFTFEDKHLKTGK